MLEFDSWQRCETVRHLLNWALPDPGRILDVGGYPGRMRGMIPDHEWVICDPLVDAPGEQICGSAVHLPIADQAFDMSVSLDVLEHIPPEDRQMVLQEMIRVSRMGLILTFPVRTPLVEAAEKHVCETYEHLHQREHPWLAEHALYPLPDADEIIEYLGSFGGQVVVFDVGDITRWVYLQLVDILLEALPGSLDFAVQFDQIYQEKLYIHDFKPPAYRKIVLHMFHMDDPIPLSMIATTREEQAADDIEFHKTVTDGLLDLVMRGRPSLLEPEEEILPEEISLEEISEETPEETPEEIESAPEESAEEIPIESQEEIEKIEEPEELEESKEEPIEPPTEDQPEDQEKIQDEILAILREEEQEGLEAPVSDLERAEILEIDEIPKSEEPEFLQEVEGVDKLEDELDKAEETSETYETLPEGFEEYVTRLEAGLQAWEETYNLTMQEMAEIYQWRNNLEQRRSFRIYRRFMRIFGVKIAS